MIRSSRDRSSTTPLQRHRLAVVAGAAAAHGDRHALAVAGGKRADHLGLVARLDHQIGADVLELALQHRAVPVEVAALQLHLSPGR